MNGNSRKIRNKDIGLMVRQARKEQKLTQAQIAQKFDISYQQWQKYESGKNRIPVITLIGFCRILDLDINMILDSIE